MRRTSLVLIAAGVALTAGPAVAAPTKPVTQTFTFTDATADMTSFIANSSNDAKHCSDGVLPEEKPHTFVAPGPGTVKITLAGFQGDWALELRDPKSGRNLAGDDVNPPDYETALVKLKAGGPVDVLPCNLAGTPEATVTLVFTPKK